MFFVNIKSLSKVGKLESSVRYEIKLLVSIVFDFIGSMDTGHVCEDKMGTY